MRLHRLEVTAFGPFAGTQCVDFDVLADGGLFLFTGATGAGKTSILDAVCFALYGDVPGARRASRSLRSDHAGVGVGARVVLEVSLQGRRLRITRSPQWDRPKLRGSGTTTEPARVHLEERPAGTWRTLSTRNDETARELDDLLGLSLAQFCQVVLLPQGQFAEFLRADAEKRRELLESLFDTGRFTGVERWLVARRQQTGRELEDADQKVRDVLARIAEVAGQEVPDDLRPATALPWVDRLLHEARAELSAARSLEKAVTGRHNKALAALEKATLVIEAHARRSALQERLASLSLSASVHEASAAEIAAARSVAPLMPLVAEVVRLQLELESARATTATSSVQLLASLPATGTDGTAGGTAPALPPPSMLAAAAREHRAEVGGLRALTKDEDEADRLAVATDSLAQRVVELEAQGQRLTAQLEAAPARRTQLAAARELSHAAAAALPGATAAVEAALLRLQAAEQRDALTASGVAAQEHLRTATDDAQAARETWLRLRQARLEGMAAELAAGLVPGADCPVCGSVDHPRPAEAAADAVDRDAEDEAAARVDALDARRAGAADELAVLEASIAAARAAGAGDITITVLREQHQEASREADRIALLAARAEADAAGLLAFGERHEGLMRQQVSLDQDAKNLRAQVATDGERLARLRTTLDDARGGDPTIAARAARLAALADELDALARQVGLVEQLEDQVGAALERAEKAALARGLESLEDVAALHRDDAEVTRLDDERRHYEADLSSVREQLEEPTLTALADRAAPDVPAIRHQVDDLQAERSGAGAVTATAAARSDAVQRLSTMLRQVVDDRAPVAAHHATVDALSRLAEGKSSDNRLRMSLSGYVLAARLEQVAASASERLSRMSSGRYQLVHCAEASTARARGGLHLRVLDAWTGVERDPASLSGGESFSASLALALGLADVVTQEAGGSLLETLFVDEGFGSLDEETLDDVMGVMDGLREGGRVVGIVSHVADLRQRIPTQLRVDKGRDGSHIRQ